MSETVSREEIQKVEAEIYELSQKLTQMKKKSEAVLVNNYDFQSIEGKVSLLDLFGENERLLVIHNMGQGCRYCTLWGDGLSPFLPHLETAMSVVMVSKDSPDLQRRFANSRGWRFRMVSHGGGNYIQEQTVMQGQGNMPGAVFYERKGDQIYRKNQSIFGPYDLYCSIWHFLGLAGLDEQDWTPQYNYWKRPEKLDDGGANVL